MSYSLYIEINIKSKTVRSVDILTNYRSRITELSEELNHCVTEYNKLIEKEENQNKTNAVKFKEKKRRKSPQKEQALDLCDSGTSQFS